MSSGVPDARSTHNLRHFARPDPKKFEKDIIPSEIWISGCAKVLNCQRCPKKRAYGLSSGPPRSVSLEFWGTRCAIYTLFTALGLCWGRPPQILHKLKLSIWGFAAEPGSRAAGRSQGNRAHAFRMTLVAQGKLPQINR